MKRRNMGETTMASFVGYKNREFQRHGQDEKCQKQHFFEKSIVKMLFVMRFPIR